MRKARVRLSILTGGCWMIHSVKVCSDMKLWNRMVFKSFLFDVERRQKHANNIPQKGVINQFRRHRIVISSSSSSSEHESPAGSLVPAGPRGIDKLTYARFPAALIASYSTAADVTSKLYPYKDLWFGIFKRGPHVQNFGIWTMLLYRYWNACLVPYLDYWNACLFLQSFLLSLAYFDDWDWDCLPSNLRLYYCCRLYPWIS